MDTSYNERNREQRERLRALVAGLSEADLARPLGDGAWTVAATLAHLAYFDTRVAATLESPLVAEDAFAEDYHAVLVHQTRKSGLRVAAAMDHELDTDDGLRCDIQAEDDLARLTAAVDVPEGSCLRVTKYVAYGWSARRSAPALRAQADPP